MGEAIQTSQNLYPELLEQNPNLLFMLKCRQFIEMVNGTDSKVRPSKSPRSQSNSPSMSPSYNSYHNRSSPAVSPSRCHSPFLNLKPAAENNNNSIEEMNVANRAMNGEVVNGNSPPEISSTTEDGIHHPDNDVEMENLDNENIADGVLRTIPPFATSNGTVITSSSYRNGDDLESAHDKVGNEMGKEIVLAFPIR